MTHFPSLPSSNVSDDPTERWLYAQDMAPVPRLLVEHHLKTVPDIVARPQTAEEVSAIARESARERWPMTTRAAATTSYFQTVPTCGGVVLDVNELRGLVSVDEAACTVNVLPGTRWLDLDDELRSRGLATCSYPTSGIAATVGGWVSTGGRGIGSLRYGPLAGLVSRGDVVLAGGEMLTLSRESDPPLEWFSGAEGTLGVLTELTLRVRHRPELAAEHLLACDDPHKLQASLLSLSRTTAPPYTILFTDESYAAMLAAAGFDSPRDCALLLVALQGTRAEVDLGRQRLAMLEARDLGEAAALREWDERFYHLRVKRGGPSLLAAEMTLPLEGLAEYLLYVARLAQSIRTPIGSYGVVISAQEALVMSVYSADQRKQYRYLLAVGVTKRLQDLGTRCGGRPYGVGFWNTPYLPRIFSRQALVALRARKRRLDPLNQLNPGKLYQSRFPLWPWLFGPAAAALATGYAVTRRWR